MHCSLLSLAFIQIELQIFAKIWHGLLPNTVMGFIVRNFVIEGVACQPPSRLKATPPLQTSLVRSGATYFHLRNGIGQLGKFWLLQHSEPEIFIRKYLFYASHENHKKCQNSQRLFKVHIF